MKVLVQFFQFRVSVRLPSSKAASTDKTALSITTAAAVINIMYFDHTAGTRIPLFSERELKFMFAICQRPSVCRLSSVCLSSVVCRLSVTFVRPTQAIEIFGNISTLCGTLAILNLCIKILRRSSQGNPSVGGVKHKRGSRI